MTKKWLDLFLVQSSIPLSQGWLDLRSVKSPADRRTKAARRNASAISSAVISSLANGAASKRPSGSFVIVRSSSVGDVNAWLCRLAISDSEADQTGLCHLAATARPFSVLGSQ
jgi:hypothetical protein